MRVVQVMTPACTRRGRAFSSVGPGHRSRRGPERTAVPRRDGIMSAINFKVDFARRSDPGGDRVVVTFDGHRAARHKAAHAVPAS